MWYPSVWAHLFSLCKGDPSCFIVPADCTVPVDHALSVTSEHIALVHMFCFCLMWGGRRKDDGCVMTVTFSLDVRTPLPPACQDCFVCLHPSHTVVDIPPQPPSNNLRWPVFTEASADLLCHRGCWRFSGSMSLHSWDGEKEDSQDQLGSFNSLEKTKNTFLTSSI